MRVRKHKSHHILDIARMKGSSLEVPSDFPQFNQVQSEVQSSSIVGCS